MHFPIIWDTRVTVATSANVDVPRGDEGIMYVLSTGCQWRGFPKDLPPRRPPFRLLDLVELRRTLDSIHHAYMGVPRARQGEKRGQSKPPHHRQPKRETSAKKRGAVIDPHGMMLRGKKIKGKKKRHFVDTMVAACTDVQSGRYQDPRRRFASCDTVRDVFRYEKAVCRRRLQGPELPEALAESSPISKPK